MHASLLVSTMSPGQWTDILQASYTRAFSPDPCQVLNPLAPHPLTVVNFLLFLHNVSDLVFGVRVGHHDEAPGLGVRATGSGAWRTTMSKDLEGLTCLL